MKKGRPATACGSAHAGCNDRDIMAVTGYATAAMVRRYTGNARRKRATAAITKLDSARKGTDGE